MPDNLQRLVRRRLWELNGTAEEASQRSGRVLSAEAIERMATSQRTSWVGVSLAEPLARALDVPEERVRRAAGLRQLSDGHFGDRRVPHLRLVREDKP